MVVMCLDSHHILHIVGEGTQFSTARFQSKKSSKTIWDTFLKLWSKIYTALPNRILTYQATYFGALFVHVTAIGNGKVETPPFNPIQALGSPRDTINKYVQYTENCASNHLS